MNKAKFLEILNNYSNKLEYRNPLVNSCISNPLWVRILLENMALIDEKQSTYSARIFELVCKKKLDIISPFLDEFIKLLPKVKLEGSIRPCAKVCELLIIRFFKENNIYYKSIFSENQLKKIVETCFDWMITDKSIAIQVYTMQTLFLLGNKFDWIHNELSLIIEKNIPTASTGYKNRGRKVLKAIKTKSKLEL